MNLTPLAITKIKEFADSEGLAYSVRVKILGGGCAGLSRDMAFETIKTDIDEEFMFEDIRIIVDPLSLSYLQGTSIDYQESPFGGGFKFNTPNEISSCGCGSSFTV